MSVRGKVHVNAHYTRSVNLERDADSLDVAKAYIPTATALKLFARVSAGFGGAQMPRAWSLIGPYGSGKSSSSVFLSHLLSAADSEAAPVALRKLKAADPRLARLFREETAGGGYLKVLITGAPEPMGRRVAKGLHEAAEVFFGGFSGPRPKAVARIKGLLAGESVSVSELSDALEMLQSALARKGCGGIYLVIDELGKFLEYEAQNYGANDIYILQALAEHACKGGECNLFLLALLHQSFEQYAKGLSEGLRNEWSKVQGRFEDVSFLESPEQMLRVIGAAFEHNLTEREERRIRLSLNKSVGILSKIGALPKAMGKKFFMELMSSCHPLHPVSAVLLPLLCQKVAQNERTLFSYLGSHEEFGFQDMLDRLKSVDEQVLPHHIYDYFIANQPAALADHRVHRRWAEVVTAVDRLGDAPDAQVSMLKTIGLLNIIGSRGGLKASKALLETCAATAAAASRSISALAGKSIIVFRRYNGEYRVWQGSDFDLEDALRGAKDAVGRFSLARELNRLDSILPVVARRHTIDSGALRYFQPLFVDARSYAGAAESAAEPRLVFFLAAAQDDEKVFAESVVGRFSKSDVVALCLNGPQLRDATAEVIALRGLQHSRRDVHDDPVAKRELEDSLSAAERVQDMLLRRLLENPEECRWFHDGESLPVSGKRDFQNMLSGVLKRVYSKAPVLHNELINRDRPSSQAIAARNRLLEAMMSAPEKPDLGIEKFPPEKAIYRSVVLAAGLHVHAGGGAGRFQEPGGRSTLRHVWSEIDRFLDRTRDEARPLTDLNDLLMSPPYGVKAGVLPILYVAAYLVYQHELALYEERVYRPFWTGEMLDRFVRRPYEFTFQRFRITGLRSTIYNEYCKIIKVGTKRSIVQLATPLAKFIGALPPYSRTTKSSDLPEKARRVRDAFALSKSPEHLIFEGIPKALGYERELARKKPNLEGFALDLQGRLKELSDAYPNMIKKQIKSLAAAFHMRKDSSLEDLRSHTAGRYAGLDQYTVDVDGLRAFIKRIVKKDGGDKEWLENILAFLGRKPAKNWTDADIAEADIRLSDFAKRILDLETLRVHYDKVKSHKDGDFEVILIRTVRRGRRHLDSVAVIEPKQKKAIENIKADLEKTLGKCADRGMQLAALADLVDDRLRRLAGPDAEKAPAGGPNRRMRRVGNA